MCIATDIYILNTFHIGCGKTTKICFLVANKQGCVQKLSYKYVTLNN